MSEYIVELPNGGAADDYIRLRGYEKRLYGYELHEEIVRCRDCEYLIAHGTGCAYWDYCDIESIDGFCAWGERKGK